MKTIALPVLPTTVSISPINNYRFHDRYAHLFRSGDGAYVFLADGSRVYRLDETTYVGLEEAMRVAPERILTMLEALFPNESYVDDRPSPAPPVHSFSLALARSCNLGCLYCYADQGQFGTDNTAGMSFAHAKQAIDVLLAQATPSQPVNLAFMGGEPLVARKLLRNSTQYAVEQARRKGLTITFSITTNGTLVTPEDAAFFEQNDFSVTLSIDALDEIHNLIRPTRGGKSSLNAVLRGAEYLIRAQQKMQVSARVTVTPLNLNLLDTLDALIDLGFHSVGFAPMLHSPTGALEMQSKDLDQLLECMITCGQRFEEALIAGRRYPFSNMVEAMKQLHRGTHRPYPCGAGAGYFGVGGDGGIYACHRFVDNSEGAMGQLDEGIDISAQAEWLSSRHVHRQEPCSSCWARYLCGGGCHHEVLGKGRVACDYIRGWLHYSLGAYVRLLDRCPDYFFNDSASTSLTSSVRRNGLSQPD